MTEIKISKINEKLAQDLQIKNPLAIPKIVKVVINVGTGQAKTNPKFAAIVQESLESITGQKPAWREAHKAISGFKIRKGEKVGMMVTLRGGRMKDFLVKLANVVLPRMRDFRGLKLAGFDRRGNFVLGIPEQIIFPEIAHEKQDVLHGMSISIVTTAKNPQIGKKLLEAWGFPFAEGSSKALPSAQGKPSGEK